MGFFKKLFSSPDLPEREDPIIIEKEVVSEVELPDEPVLETVEEPPPTEEDEDEREERKKKLRDKRRGRKSTISAGELTDELLVSQKTLLGG